MDSVRSSKESVNVAKVVDSNLCHRIYHVAQQSRSTNLNMKKLRLCIPEIILSEEIGDAASLLFLTNLFHSLLASVTHFNLCSTKIQGWFECQNCQIMLLATVYLQCPLFSSMKQLKVEHYTLMSLTDKAWTCLLATKLNYNK